MVRLHRLVIPSVGLHKPLHGPDGVFIQKLKGDGLDGFGLFVAQKPGNICQAQTPMLLPAKTIMELPVKLHEFFGNQLNICFSRKIEKLSVILLTKI